MDFVLHMTILLDRIGTSSRVKTCRLEAPTKTGPSLVLSVFQVAKSHNLRLSAGADSQPESQGLLLTMSAGRNTVPAVTGELLLFPCLIQLYI